jgi:hypothetical protein
MSLIEFRITEMEKAIQISLTWLTKPNFLVLDLKEIPLGTTISNAQYSKLNYLENQITSSMQKVGKGRHYYFAKP